MTAASECCGLVSVPDWNVVTLLVEFEIYFGVVGVSQ